MTLVFLVAIHFLPDIFTAPIVALLYWLFGSLIVFHITRILRSELKLKSELAEALKQQKSHLENLIESAPEGIVWIDEHSRIKYVNHKFFEIFGYNFQDAKGKNVDELLNPTNALVDAQEITEAVYKGTSEQFETIRYHKDGTAIHVSIVGASTFNLKGKKELFALYRDISQEKLAEQRLINSEQSLRTISAQLLDANNFKELLLDIITHDLRNPASVISGSLEILEEELPNHEILDVVRKSSDNLFEVIESASTLSKLSMGESIDMEKLDLVPILKGVARTFKSQLSSAKMTLTLDLPDQAFVRANRIIGEVISNYISNGIKYASSGQTLHLAIVKEAHSLQIELQDLGKTIPEDKRERIFERKIQLVDGPRRGSGLGLAIVKRIASAHQATAGVRSNKPVGNIFYFRFEFPQQSNPDEQPS